MDFKKEEREIAAAEKQWLARKDQLEREQRSAGSNPGGMTRTERERFDRREAALGVEQRTFCDRASNLHVQERAAINTGQYIGSSPIRSFGKTYTNEEAAARIMNLEERAARDGVGSDRLRQEARELTAGLRFNSPAAAQRTVQRAVEIARREEARVQAHVPGAVEQAVNTLGDGLSWLLRCRCRCHQTPNEACPLAIKGENCCSH